MPVRLFVALIALSAACRAPEPTKPAVALPDADLVFVSMEDGIEDIYVLDPETGERFRVTVTDSVAGELRGSWVPSWSPDRERIVFASNRDDGGSANLYAVDRDGSNLVRLTDREGYDYNPDFSPDGTRIAFLSDRDGGHDLYSMAADGSDVRRITELSAPAGQVCCADWHPDGTRLVFMIRQGGFFASIWTVNSDGSDARQVLAGAGVPRWSPDGSSLAYTGTGMEIFVSAADGSDPRQITELGGTAMYPAWSPDGTRIAFSYLPDGSDVTSDDAELYVVRLDGSTPVRLTENDFLDAHASWW